MVFPPSLTITLLTFSASNTSPLLDMFAKFSMDPHGVPKNMFITKRWKFSMKLIFYTIEWNKNDNNFIVFILFFFRQESSVRDKKYSQ